MEKFYFEKPSMKRKNEIIEYLDEFVKYNSEINGAGSLDKIYEGYTFEEALERCLNMENKEYAKSNGRCQGKTFLLIRENDNRIVGTINVRWNLNEEMLRFGGHIGYGIRPTERRKGYNKINLYLGLIEARKVGLDKVMLDCSVNNLGSDRTIQSLGGVLERCEKDPYDGELTNVYWIDVNESLEKYKNTYEQFVKKSYEETTDLVEKMKKIVLHLHLDGSLRPETVLEWIIDDEDYKSLGFESKEDLLKLSREKLLEKVRKALMVSKDCRDLNEYLEKFDMPCKKLQTETHIVQAVYELFEDLSKQNVIYAEVRFAPSKHREKGLNYDKIVEAAIKGMDKAKEEYNIGGSLILCTMRGDSENENLETIKVASKYIGKGVSAVDLAGAEALFPTSDYEYIFKEARRLNIPFTIHAGEAAGAESIKKALEFGAKRIGHGVRCLEDSDLVDYLVKNNIVLEVCPISNLQTRATGEKHPIEELYRKGLKVTVNTDNNTVSNTDIINEYKWVLEHTKLDLNDLKQMNINATKGLFGITDEEKEQLISYICM